MKEFEGQTAPETRLTTPKLNAALAKAQGKFTQPPMNKTAEVKKEGRLLYKTSYADLNHVIESFRVQLSENGLAFTQKTVWRDGGWALVLTLKHESGEEDFTEMPINLDLPPQQVGSQLTYLKRYQAAAYFGIAADADDDAQATASAENETTFTDNRPNPQKAPAKGPAPAKASRPATSKKGQTHPPIEPQAFPPDDVPAVEQDGSFKKEDRPSKDPGDFVIPTKMGAVSGLKVRDVSESKLRVLLKHCESELAVVPPRPNVGDLLEVSAKVKAFLAEMGL